MMLKKITVLFCIAVLFAPVLKSQEHGRYVPETDPLVLDKLEQWQDLKFGLLMHWGAYSQWGIVESWSICPEDYGWCERKMGSYENYFKYVEDYENLQKTFNPVNFDPDNWAAAASYAGMKYVVFTTKHHDGFCMFDTKYTDYKITGKDCPFHTHPKANVTGEIFSSFRKQGLWTGAYFSKPDWHCDDYWDPYFPPMDRNVNYDPYKYPERWQRYVDFTHNQILELCSDYGKLDILWLDGGWVKKNTNKEIVDIYTDRLKDVGSGFVITDIIDQDVKMDELVVKAREKQPGLIVVDRAVEGKNQNYLTPENQVPEKELPYPWESCIIAGGGWSWVNDAQYRSANDLIHLLVDIVCKGGNLLLNIAPGPQGQWHEDAYLRLKDIGDWMQVNGGAIYGTRAISPYREGKVCFTRDKVQSKVYAIYLAGTDELTMPAEIEIDAFKSDLPKKVTLLGVSKAIKVRKTDKGFVIMIPESVRKNPPCKHAWSFKLEGIPIK